MSNDDQTSGAANHVDQALGTIEEIFDTLGKRAAAFKDRAKKEAAEIHSTFDLADQVVNDRMVDANLKFRKFLGAGSNFAPRVEADAQIAKPVSTLSRGNTAGRVDAAEQTS